MNNELALSVKQMRHLQELGLDTSDASMFYDESGGISDYQTDIPAYTLTDILKKLPATTKFDTGFSQIPVNLIIKKGKFADGEYFGINYTDTMLGHVEYKKESLLEQAYNLLVWCIENGYIKTDKI